MFLIIMILYALCVWVIPKIKLVRVQELKFIIMDQKIISNYENVDIVMNKLCHIINL